MISLAVSIQLLIHIKKFKVQISKFNVLIKFNV